MSDFTEAPDNVIDEEPIFSTLVSEFENGYEQRRAKWASPKRKWVLEFKNRIQSEMETIRNFFITKKGEYSSFTWTNPIDSTEYTVRFDEDSLLIQRKAFEIYDITLKFVEVF